MPEALLSFAEREFRTMTFNEFKQDRTLPVFVKPLHDLKLFSGGVIENQSTKALAIDCPDDTDLLVSDVVEMASEYRVFVSRSRGIESMRHYLGNEFLLPSKARIQRMIEAFAPSAPVAYSLDVAILNSGETAIVECNDFWALGTYGFDPVRYCELSAQRWHEMLS